MKLVVLFYLLGATMLSYAIADSIEIKNQWPFDAGIVASLDTSVIKDAKDIHWNYLMNILHLAPVPDFDFHNAHVNQNRFYIIEDSKKVDVAAVTNSTKLLLSANDLVAGFTSSNFSDKQLFLSAKGRAEVKFYNVSINAEIEFVSQTQNGQESIAIEVGAIKIDIPEDYMDITVHGNIFTKLSHAFKALYITKIREKLERSLENRIHHQFPKMLNREAQEKETSTKLSDDLSINWHLAGAPFGVNDKIILPVKGFERKHEGAYMTRKIPKLPDTINFYDSYPGFTAYISNVTQGYEKDFNAAENIYKLMHMSSAIDVFEMFRLTNIQVAHYDTYTLITAKPVFIAPKWLPRFVPQTIPHMSSEWSFWLEHLDHKGRYTKKLSQSIVYRVHKWLKHYLYDSWGFVKAMDDMYRPYLYWILGEKDPEVDN